MSSKDKTRTKLVGSMRKTKAGINADNADTAGAEPTPPAAEPPRAPAPKPAKAAAPARTTKPNPDNYRSGRRVWPD